MKWRKCKRGIALMLAVILFGVNCPGIAYVQAESEKTEYYNEDFESGYTAGGSVSWMPRDTGNKTTTLKTEAGNTVLQVNQPSTVGTSQWFTNVFSAGGLTGTYEITFDIQAKEGANGFVFLTDAANSKSILQLCIRDNGYFCMDTGDGFPWNHKITDSFTKNQWYSVQIIVDTDAQKYTIEVDDNGQAEFPFREAAGNLGAIRIGCGSTTKDNISIDNIVVKDYAKDGAEEEYYNEDFESGYTAGGSVSWTPRDTGNTTTTLKAEADNMVLQVNQPSTVGTSQWFTNVFSEGGLTGTYEITFDIQAKEGANAFVFFTDAANSKSILQLCIRDNGYFCMDTGDGFPWNHKITDSFTKNQWYSVQIIVDTDEQKFTIGVDDNGKVEFPFREAAGNLGAIRFGCGSTTKDNVSIDNIVVKDYIKEGEEGEEKGIKVIYEQDFQENTTSDFTDATNTSGTLSITETEQGNLSLTVDKTSTGSGSYLVNHDLGKVLSSGVVTVSVKMMPTALDAVSYFLLTDASNNAVAQLGFYDTRGIAYQIRDDVIPCGSYEANQWYTFKLVFDTSERIYHIYVDDTLVAENIEYSNRVDISRIRLGMYNFSSGRTYYDDISVVQDTLDAVYEEAIFSPVATMVGVRPALPSTVNRKDGYGFSKEFQVTWDEIDESLYAEAGSFTVNGVLDDGTEVSIQVIVISDPLEVQYHEDFESENHTADQWSSNPATGGITVTEQEDGNKVAEIEKTTASGSVVLTKELDKELGKEYERVQIRSRLMVDSKNSNAYFAVSDANGNNLARVELYNAQGTICVRNYGGTNAVGYYGFGSYEAGKWYDIQFEFYPAQERYHVYVNGQKLMSNLAYTKVGGTIKQLQVGVTDTKAGSVYFDDVEVISSMADVEYEAPAFTVTTQEGIEPELAELVNITFCDGFVDTLQVTWDAVSKEDYSKEGTFAVNGTAKSFRSDKTYQVQTEVTVRKVGETAYYVDPVNGSDSNNGRTRNSAFKTIEKAKEAVRLINGNMDGDIYVYLMDGTYSVEEAIVFDSKDSGSNGYFVIWQADKGAVPVVSGGKEVTGWTKVDGKNYYEASVPESEGYLDYFRQLYVDGERATRASGGFINATAFVSENGEYTGIRFKNTDLKEKYTNVEDILVGHISSFKYDEWHVSDIVKEDSSTVFRFNKENDLLFRWRANTSYCQTTDRFMIINAIEELDAEGEWYLDRGADKIYYYPYEGQDMSKASAYVTVVDDDQLVRFEGTGDETVKNIVLDGISFEYSNWTYTKDYSIGGSQAEALWSYKGNVKDISYGYQLPGAIRLNHTENIQILNNTLSHMAACGISVYNDARNTLIEGNVTYDTTGAGIAIGRFCGSYLNDDRNETETEVFGGDNPEGRVSDTIVRNNIVTDTGRDFLQATGISLMAALRTTVTHNVVDNTAYMGIHTRLEVAGYYLTRTDVTYNGNSTDTNLDVGQNIIAYNEVQQANWAHQYGLNDNASIYNFGPSTGTLIYRNYISEDSNTDWGMYNDDNSHNVIWQENVVSGKNLYMSPRCVDKNTIVLRNNYGIGWILDDMCIDSGNSSSYTSEEAKAVISQAGVEDAFTEIADKLPDTDAYHEIYKNYDNLNIAGGKITEGNPDYIEIIAATGTNTQSDHPEEDAYDGYLNSYWGSGTNFPESIIFTLKEESEIYNVETYWYDPSGRYYQYRIYVSTTGTAEDDFTLVCDNSKNTVKGFTRDYLNNCKAKYVKVEITNSSLNSAAIREIVFNRQAEEITGVSLSRTQITTVVGKQITLTASVLPANADQTVTWSSSNAKVASVEDGVVSMLAEGTATITVQTINGKTAVCEVTVYEPENLPMELPVKIFTFDDDTPVKVDANGNVMIVDGAGKDGTKGLVIKDTYNALEWNGGVQSVENSRIRDELVSGKVANPLKNNEKIKTSGLTITYDRYMPADHNGYESFVRFGDYDMTIQSGWFMFEPQTYAEHFCFNRDTEYCVSTPVGEWVSETYTFDPVTDTACIYRNGKLIYSESRDTAGTQIGEGEILKMMEYLASCDDITFGGAASWFSTLGVTIDNFALFETCLTEEQVELYLTLDLTDKDPEEPGDEENPTEPGDTENPTEPGDEENPTNPGDAENPTTPDEGKNVSDSNGGNDNVPSTGDAHHLLFPMILLVLSGLMIILTGRKRQKQ